MTEAIEKKQTGALAIPSHLQDVHSHEGFGNMSKDDMILPRLGICQSLSPQRKKSDPKHIEGLEEGDLFNTITGENFKTSVDVIPMLFSKTRIYFRSLAEGGGILCQSTNGVDGGSISQTCAACPNSQFAGDGKAPLCNVFFNYPALVLPSQDLTIVSLKSSALKVARQWNSRMQMLAGDKPMFAAVYSISSVTQKSSKGEFFGPVIKFKRFTTAEEFEYAKAIFASLQGKTIKTDETGLGEEEEPAPF